MKAVEKHIVSPELIAYLKWLIYTAPFKDPFSEPRGAIHRQFYLEWLDAFASKEDTFRKRLMVQLEIWYSRFPSGQKRGSSSRADNVPKANCRRSTLLNDPGDEDGGRVLDQRLTATVLVARAVLVNY